MRHRNIRNKLWLQNPTCFVCKKIIDDFSETSLEHIVPIARGGNNRQKNLAVSHPACNHLKAELLKPKSREIKLQENI